VLLCVNGGGGEVDQMLLLGVGVVVRGCWCFFGGGGAGLAEVAKCSRRLEH
jgi:hypothetical protein